MALTRFFTLIYALRVLANPRFIALGYVLCAYTVTAMKYSSMHDTIQGLDVNIHVMHLFCNVWSHLRILTDLFVILDVSDSCLLLGEIAG